jgi:glycosyltransferase involved in cell wall biosynthesis
MPGQRPRLSIFFPAFNEEANIAETVGQAMAVAAETAPTWEVIVVDDGSSDRTGEIVARLAAEHPDVRLIQHERNQGYGGALTSGLRGSRGELIFFSDADLQFDLSELSKLMEHIDDVDLVIGYRAPRRDPFMRLVNAWGWKVLNNTLFGLKVRDIDCAFKLFRRECLDRIPIRSSGAMVSAEILIRLRDTGHKWVEVPVTHQPRTAGSPTGAKPAVILRAFREMFWLYPELARRTHKQFVKYLIVGAANTGLDAGIYLALTRLSEFWGEHYIGAKMLSFAAGMANSFMWNRVWTFRAAAGGIGTQIIRFLIVQLTAMGINAGVLYAMVSWVGTSDLIGLIPAIGASTVTAFLANKLWTFRRPS